MFHVNKIHIKYQAIFSHDFDTLATLTVREQSKIAADTLIVSTFIF